MGKKKEKKLWYKKHKVAAAILVVVILTLMTLFGTKLYLYLKFLLGNDLIVELDTPQSTYRVYRGEAATVMFTASFTTNPMCKSLCSVVFEDISSGEIIDTSEFNAETNLEYSITAPTTGVGMKIYRIDLKCKNLRSFFCPTDQKESTRSQLVTLRYDLSPEEEAEIATISSRLNDLGDDIEDMKSLVLSYSLADFDVATPGLDLTIQSAQQRLNKHRQNLASTDWNTQDVQKISNQLVALELESNATVSIVEVLGNLTNDTIQSYNQAIVKLRESSEILIELSRYNVTDSGLAVSIANEIINYNNMIRAADIEQLLQTANRWHDRMLSLDLYIRNETHDSALEYEVTLDILSEAICKFSDVCPDNSIEFRINQTFNIADTCSRTRQFTRQFESARINVTEPYTTSAVISNGINSNRIRDTISTFPEIRSARDIENLIPSCEIIMLDYDEILTESYRIAKIPEPVTVDLNISFTDAARSCEVFGQEHLCCISCDAPPVLMLHGHAFSKDLAAQYSLEGFNDIQRELEKTGFLNAGSITISEQEETDLALIPIPLVFRGSYYIDIFGEPGDYVTVQAKSESIDTYAIRLRELVDILSERTGKPKVRIVAYSMGGLVARRYMQIFGTDKVESLTLIGTPNKGVVGNVADYCPVLGEKLECRDMNSESLFINKLNRDPLPDIPVYNIVGTGCGMKEGQGDGVVLEQNAIIQGAENKIFTGSCEGKKFQPLHLDLRNVEKYPEVYEYLLSTLT